MTSSMPSSLSVANLGRIQIKCHESQKRWVRGENQTLMLQGFQFMGLAGGSNIANIGRKTTDFFTQNVSMQASQKKYSLKPFLYLNVLNLEFTLQKHKDAKSNQKINLEQWVLCHEKIDCDRMDKSYLIFMILFFFQI